MPRKLEPVVMRIVDRSGSIGPLSGFTYGSNRGVGPIDDPAFFAALRATPLAQAIMRVYRDLNTQGVLPVGPRGCGYVLLGSKIKFPLSGIERTVQKEKPVGGDETLISFDQIKEAINVMRRVINPATGNAYLPWGWVADGRSEEWRPDTATDAADAVATLRVWADQIGPDILADQDVYIEFWCEATGLAQAVANIAGSYGVAVYSGSGDVPAPAIRLAAQRWAAADSAGKDVKVFIIGDRDIDGMENGDRIYSDGMAWFEYFAGQLNSTRPDIVWLAPDDVHLTNPDGTPSPAAAGVMGAKTVRDGKGAVTKHLPWTMQAEALLRGGMLRQIVTDAIEDELDIGVLNSTRSTWEGVAAPLVAKRLDALAKRLRSP